MYRPGVVHRSEDGVQRTTYKASRKEILTISKTKQPIMRLKHITFTGIDEQKEL